MSEHNVLGKEGEEMAAKWLVANGYELLHRNWRYGRYEIDIIAQKNDCLHIIEVKIRHYSPFCYPEGSVTRKKFKSLQWATDQFLFLNPGYKWLQYGILAITLFHDREPEYFLLEDVYLWREEFHAKAQRVYAHAKIDLPDLRNQRKLRKMVFDCKWNEGVNTLNTNTCHHFFNQAIGSWTVFNVLLMHVNIILHFFG